MKLYRRSPLQVAILMFFTGGLYVFWWSFFVLRDCRDLLEEPDEKPLAQSLLLLVPILNFYLLFRLFDRIKTLALRAQIYSVPSALAALGIVWLALAIAGRLPMPVAVFAMFSFLPAAFAQIYIVRAERRLNPSDSGPVSFNVVEWIVLFIGAVYRVILCVFYMTVERSGEFVVSPLWWLTPLCLAASLTLMILVHQRGKALLAADIAQDKQTLTAVPA